MPQPKVSKRCEICRSEYATSRPDRAKYCDFCAAANAILHFRTKTAKCLACKEVFCLASRRDLLCAKCDHQPRFCRAVVRGKCSWCHTDAVTLADKEIPVCFRCWKDPGKRERLVQVLAKKRAARTAVNTPAVGAAH